jgi:hypothetical protein
MRHLPYAFQYDKYILIISTIQDPGSGVAVFPGDLIPTAAHVPVPWIMGYDLDPRTMVKFKEKLLPQWEKEHALVFFVHETRYPWGFITRDPEGSCKGYPLDSGRLEPLRRVRLSRMP